MKQNQYSGFRMDGQTIQETNNNNNNNIQRWDVEKSHQKL